MVSLLHNQPTNNSMFKLTAIYRQVDDPNTLDTFFSHTHLPLAEKLPGLLKTEVSRIPRKPGGQSRFWLMYEIYFESEDALIHAFGTETGIQLIQALKPWADARLLTWFYAEVYEEETKGKL